LEKTIAEILSIISDYHNHRGFQFSVAHILSWSNQFKEGDREFILQELLHLLRQGIYISEKKGRTLLITRIETLSKRFGFAKPILFLANTEFLRLQSSGKSQDILLQLLNEELIEKYGMGLAQCGTISKKYAVYLDDVLATGNTIFGDLSDWLPIPAGDGESNLEKVIKREKILVVSVFCLHLWHTVDWRLKIKLGKDEILRKILYFRDYEIQNHPKFVNQRLNFAYPVAQQPQQVLDYLGGLDATAHEAVAFRKENLPTTETFYSSAANRIRFENILLHYGIELLGKAATLKPNHRPLGATFPSYKTFGTGTLFFTWRNISNTSPIVFWWEAGGWRPFFPLFGRGLGGTTSGT
jgi:hypothetical protein